MHKILLLLPLAALIAGATPPTTSLSVDVEQLRNGRGLVHACLSRDQRNFLSCERDPAAITQTLPAGASIHFAGFPPGDYALTLFHDENANQKLDMLLGIPREGFGFSRNPKVRFGAPKFRQVTIELGPGFSRQSIRMQYVL